MRLPRRDMGAQKMTGDKEASNKGVRGTSIKKTSQDINQFRSVLKSFLLINLFYSEEYFAWNSNRDLGLV
jgi:hypothetical protein